MARKSFTISVTPEDVDVSLDDFGIPTIEAYLAKKGRAGPPVSVEIERCWRAMAEGDIEYAADCLRRVYPTLPPLATEQRLVAGLGRAQETSHVRHA